MKGLLGGKAQMGYMGVAAVRLLWRLLGNKSITNLCWTYGKLGVSYLRGFMYILYVYGHLVDFFMVYVYVYIYIRKYSSPIDHIYGYVQLLLQGILVVSESIWRLSRLIHMFFKRFDSSTATLHVCVWNIFSYEQCSKEWRSMRPCGYKVGPLPDITWVIAPITRVK